MSFQYQECEKKKRWILFFPITRVYCSSNEDSRRSTDGTTTDHFSNLKKINKSSIFRDLFVLIHKKSFETENRNSNNHAKVNVLGGGISQIAALENMQLGDADRNWEIYSNWAASLSSFPVVIKQKVKK